MLRYGHKANRPVPTRDSSFLANISLCSENTSTKLSMIFGLNAGIKIFRRLRHIDTVQEYTLFLTTTSHQPSILHCLDMGFLFPSSYQSKAQKSFSNPDMFHLNQVGFNNTRSSPLSFDRYWVSFLTY